MNELSNWSKLDPACMSCPDGTSQIWHVSACQWALVGSGMYQIPSGDRLRHNGYQLSSWCIRSGMYQLSGGYVRSGMYQLSNGYIRSGMYQLSSWYKLDPACVSCPLRTH